MKFDVVVVGAGTAGSVIAARLTEDPGRRVGLIEAGPDFPTFDALPDKLKYHRSPSLPSAEAFGEPDAPGRPYEWNFVSRATALRPRMILPRGKAIGGSGSINGSMFVRGTRGDFESWVAAGNPEWSYERVLPYYRKLETDLDFQNEYHGSSGPIQVRRAPRAAWNDGDRAFEGACVALGQPACADHNHPDATGVGPVPRNTADGTRMSTARLYLGPARGRGNLTILADALVRQICFRGTRAVAVEVAHEGARSLVEGDEIILCAGAIGSPHVLLLSGVGPAEQLRHFGIPVVANLAGVGQNLRDHPGVRVVWRSALGVMPNGSLYLRFTARGSRLRNDCRIVGSNSEGEGLASSHVGLYLAASRGELRLRSADPGVQLEIDFRYYEEESDIRRTREAVRFAFELARQPALRRFLGPVVEPVGEDAATDEGLGRWILRTSRTSHHATSTAKLGPASDPEAVVDQWGHVHGLEGLRVADSSIMPDCVSHNTNMTTIMIAERIADDVRGAADRLDPRATMRRLGEGVRW